MAGEAALGKGGAGYSETPLARKLGIAPGSAVVLLDAPDGFDQVLAPLPDGVRMTRRLPRGNRKADVAVFFVTAGADLDRRFDAVAAALTPAGGFWVAWPKRSSGVPTDLTENLIRDIGVAHGMVDNKVCAVTDVWSGLRFVVRLADRAAWPPAATTGTPARTPGRGRPGRATGRVPGGPRAGRGPAGPAP